MRYKISIIAVAAALLWSVGPLLAAEIKGADAQKELQKFQGTWVMVSGEKDGKKAADEHVSHSKMIIESNKAMVVVPDQTKETILLEIVKLDPSKNPKEYHFVRKTGPNAGKKIIGIYEFEGDDMIKFAFDPAGKTKLKEFTTKAGTGHIRYSWKRVKQ